MMVSLELEEAEVLACLCNESTVTDNLDIMLIWFQRFLFFNWVEKYNINNFLSGQKQYKTKNLWSQLPIVEYFFPFVCLFVSCCMA